MMDRRLVLTAALALLLPLGCTTEENNGADGGNNGNNGADTGGNNGADMGGNNGADMGGNNGADTGGNNGADTGGNNGVDMGGNNGVDMGGSSPWTVSAHPCVGNRTDALWCDDADNCFVSCGTTTNGDTGLYVTADGGANWAQFATTTPAAFFDAARVNSISRSADGNLYIGGDLPNSAAVVAVDAGGTVSEVFTRGNQVGNAFTVGQFRRAANGYAIAESLNGTDILVREMDGGDPTDSWTDGKSFYNDGDADDVASGVQILDLEVHDDQFWGVGSRINQPPMVFTPNWQAGSFDFNIVALATGLGEFNGELWGLDVNADGAAVGGVNQDRNVGMVYTLPANVDGVDAANWTAFDVSTIFAGQTTWVTDVCRASNDVVYAVGRESSEGWGFVLMSTDGGTSFEDITPYDMDGASTLPDVSRCQAFDAGVVIAGMDGLFARNF